VCGVEPWFCSAVGAGEHLLAWGWCAASTAFVGSEFAGGGARLDVGDYGVETLLERAGIALHLGEQEPALECGEGRDSEIVGVGGQLSAFVHLAESGSDAGLPAVEGGCDARPGMVVDLGQFAAEGPNCATADALQLALMFDEEVSPRS
jgi:hypothetical protein